MTTRAAPQFTLSVTREEDRFACAAEGVRIGRWVGLSERAAQEVAIAIAELVSNAVRHGGGGTIEIRAIRGVEPAAPASASGRIAADRLGPTSTAARPNAGMRWGVEVVVRDRGPGLDADAAMEKMAIENAPPKGDPRLPGQGLGLGLGAVYRLMSSVVIRSAPGQGAEVTAIRWE